MNIVITGATGFVGSHIVKELIESNHKVTIIHRSSSNFDRLNDVSGRYSRFDCSKLKLESLCSSEAIDAVVHCATSYARGNNIDDIDKCISTNMQFPIELMSFAKKRHCKAFINTCSFFTKRNIDEICNINTYMSQYVLTKRQFREWGEYISSDNSMLFINMQLEHVYGLDDNDQKFFPSLIKAIKNNESSFKLSSGLQKRDFISVEDVAKAYACVLDQIACNNVRANTTYEVGTGQARTLKEFVEAIKRAYKSDIMLNWGAIRPTTNELLYSKANPQSLLDIGWMPKITKISDIEKYFSYDQE